MRIYKKSKLVLFALLISTIALTVRAVSSEVYAGSFTEIRVNIPTGNDAKTIEYSKLHEGKYCVYGPYDGNDGDYIKISLKNDIVTYLEVAISSKNDITKGQIINNTRTKGTRLEGYVDITANDDGQYYIFVGARNIKNLTGTLKIVTNNSSSNKNNISNDSKWDNDDWDDDDWDGRIINNNNEGTTEINNFAWNRSRNNNFKDSDYIANVVEHLENVSSDEVKEIHIKANNFGVLVEKSEGNDFEFEAVGVKDRKNVLSYKFDNSNKENLIIDIKGSVDKISVKNDQLILVISLIIQTKKI